jgi:hypothetical protein
MWRAFGAARPEIGGGPAFDLWRNWQADSHKGTLALVHAAILSSNAFNTQPWLFRVSTARIELYADAKRNLGAFDPYLREMYFSVGCALENLLLAAPANGFRAALTLMPGKLLPPFPQPKPELAALVDLSPGKPISSALFAAIPHRHTNRTLFDGARELPTDYVSALENVVRDDEEDVRLFLFRRASERKAITDIIWDTSRALLSDPEVRRGTQRWYRTTPDEVQRLRDGEYVGEPDPASYVDLMTSGRLFGLIAVRDRYDRAQTIRAGRVWQRAHLLATARAVAARPANGAVEIIDHERRLNLEPKTAARLARLTGDASWQPTFMFYMGYATVPGVASPRRSIQEVLS